MINKRIKFVIILIIILIPNILAIPQSLTLNGKLTDSSGSILSGDYNMTFKFYSDYTGGSSMLTIANQTVSVGSDGIYHTFLQGINLTFVKPTYLGIAVRTDSEMSPRINLTSSPYSFRSNVTENLNASNNYELENLTANGRIGIGISTPTMPLDVRGSELNGFLVVGDGTGSRGSNAVITIDRTTNTEVENAHGFQDYTIFKKVGSYNSFDSRITIPDGSGDNYQNKHLVGFQATTSYDNTDGTLGSTFGSTIGQGSFWSVIGNSVGTTTGRVKHFLIDDINFAGTVTNQYGLFVEDGGLDAGTNGNWVIYNNEDNATIYTAGLVGVGVPDPFDSWNLAVSNGIHVEGINPVIGITDTGGEDWGIVGGSSGFGIFGDTDNTFRFFINNSGSVGIGTITPSQKLEVVGNVNISNGGNVTIDGNININGAITANMTKVRVYKSGSNQVFDATGDIVTFQTENFDTLNEFSNPTFTAKQSGYYVIHAHALMQELGDLENWFINIEKNTQKIAQTQYVSPGAGATYNPTLDVQTVYYLDKGERIEVFAVHTQLNDRNIYLGKENTYLEIYRIA